MPARAPRIGAKPTGIGIKAGITIRGHLRLHPPARCGFARGISEPTGRLELPTGGLRNRCSTG